MADVDDGAFALGADQKPRDRGDGLLRGRQSDARERVAGERLQPLLELRRQLRQALGDSPQVLRDLSVSLMQIATSPLLTVPERKAALDEAVGLLERLAAAAPQNTTYAQLLNVARQMAQNSKLNPAA